MRLISPPLLALLLAACSSPGARAPLHSFADVGQANNAAPADIERYTIGAGDSLNITTFQVADLTMKEVRIDASGQLQMPLVGSVQAAGRTPAELGADLEALLGRRYLRNPQVTVTVAEAASQKVTVDGAVNKPGVYEMRGSTSLLQAVAMAEGPVRIADLSRVAVFRTTEGRRMVALYDLQAIRAGTAEDPQVLGNDVIVVDTSQLSAAMRDVIAALPGLAVFGVF